MCRFANIILGVGCLLIGVFGPCPAIGQERENTIIAHETIVLIRHGEKPEAGLGQLNCQGLNRSLALPTVLLSKFGKPSHLLAPDPAQQKQEGPGIYDYIRPLATIEPMAIALGLPVSTDYGFKEIDRLQELLQQADYENALVIVAWEHKQVERLARNIIGQYGGDASQVPRWEDSDFDSIYIITIDRWSDRTAIASFKHDREDLNGMSVICPTSGANPILEK